MRRWRVSKQVDVGQVDSIRSAVVRAIGVPIGIAMAALFLGTGVVAQEDCMECHDVDVDLVAGSVHGFLECLDCHPSGEELPHPDEIYGTECVNCHDDAAEEYSRSVHGFMQETGDPLVTGCEGCHGPGHELLPASDPGSPTHPLLQPDVCGSCHASAELTEREHIHLVQPLERYTASIHSRALEAGQDAASCSDCHGSHLILRSSDIQSSVHHEHISRTCSACHAEIAAQYDRSVHGLAAAQGVRESPVCTDCHGEHRILEPKRPDSPVYPSNIPRMTCERCHADVRLNEKYGLSMTKVKTYEESYHGLEARFGVVKVANCASCHGVHDILPSSNPQAHTNPANLDETCGQCHPRAGEKYSIGPVHVLTEEPENRVVYWIRIAYLWIIFLTIGGMVAHNSLDMVQKIRRPLPRPAADEVAGTERMSFAFRITHFVFMISFVVLAYSGFALKYPEAWWSCPFPFWEGSCAWRGIAHRVASVVMMAAVVAHLIHLAVDRKARLVIRGMIPNKRDLIDIQGRLGYLFGRRSHPPVAGWLSYGEKMEYLAVVWGTGVMVATGLGLWLENIGLRMFPSWVLEALTVLHLYEAILASLAIVVWHFYAVIFDPLVYPMDTAWLTGRSVPAREIEREPPPAGLTGDDLKDGFVKIDS